MDSTPGLVCPATNAAGSALLSCGPLHSRGTVRNGYIVFNPAYSQSSLYATMDRASATPLFLITSMQALYFHAIAHSFSQQCSAIPFAFNSLRTLSVAMGGGGTPLPLHDSRPLFLAAPLFSYSYELLFPQLHCFHNHLHCLGVAPALDVPAPTATKVHIIIRSATWTRRPHPTIIAASSRLQVHG